MTDKAQKLWGTFCQELIGKPTEDQAKAFATVLREIANEYQYYNPGAGEDMIIDARMLYNLAEEMDSL
jgi:hypothetical protein